MEKKINRVPRLLLGSFCLLFAGVIYAWSVIKAPFMSFGWTDSQLGLNYTVTMSAFALGGIVSGLLSKKVSGKIRIIISGILVFVGLFMTSRLTPGMSPTLLYIGYGLLTGLAIGIVYNVVVSQTGAWFPDKKGLCNGVMMMSFGLSSFILGMIAEKLFGSAAFGWSKTYLLYGIIIGAVLVFVGIFIRPPKADELPQTAAATAAQIEVTPLKMLRQASFWQLFIFFVLLSAVGGIAISFGKDVFLSVGVKQNTAVLVASMLAICNGIGRLLSGAIFDAVGIRKTQIITSAVVITACAVTLCAVAAGISWLALFGVCLCAFSYGFTPTVSAALCSSFYGRENFPMNYALLFLFLVPSSFFSAIAGKIIDAGNSFTVIFALLLGFSVIGLVDNMLIRTKGEKKTAAVTKK